MLATGRSFGVAFWRVPPYRWALRLQAAYPIWNANPFLYADTLDGIAYLTIKSTIDFFFRSIKRTETAEAPRSELINTLGKEVLLELRSHASRKSPSPEFEEIERENTDEHFKNVKEMDTSSKEQFWKRRIRQLSKRMKHVDVKTDSELPVRVGLVLYRILLEAGGITKRTVPGEKTQKVVLCSLSRELAEEVTNRLDRWANDHPVWGPTIIPPRPWKSFHNGGYHYKLKNLLPLIKKGEKGNSVEKCAEIFSAVNNLQNTSYCINQQTLEVAQEILARNNCHEYTVFFNIPPFADTSEKSVTNQTGPMVPPAMKRMWLIVGIIKILKEAERLKDESKLYFVHTMDFRGRIYTKATYLNPQGTDLCRGLIFFGESKPIENDASVDWLANHGANCFGGSLSRESFSIRKDWVRRHSNEILSLAKEPLNNMEFWKKADSPWAFLSWCQEWAKYLETGFGFNSSLPVTVDGTCNGFQHFAALTRSRTLAANVNLLPSENPSDIYTFVADAARNELCHIYAESPEYHKLSVSALLEKYYHYLYRNNFIKRNGREPKPDDYKTACESVEFPDISVTKEDYDNAGQDSVILEESAENYPGPEDEEKDEKPLHNPENILCNFGVDDPDKEIDKSRKIKLLKILQECRRQLANSILYKIVFNDSNVVFDRKLFKPVVMTFPYSASHSSNVEDIYEFLVLHYSPILSRYCSIKIASELRSQKIEFILAHSIARCARRAINNKLPLAREIMTYLRGLLPNDPEKPNINWHTPCGLNVCQRNVKISDARRKKLAYSGEIFYIRMLGDTKKADINAHRLGISPNFIHSCDATHLIKTVNAVYNKEITHFLPVHDSYSTHAADMPELNKTLREEFVKMYDENNLLENLRMELGKNSAEQFPIKEQDSFDLKAVLESPYFFA